MTIDTKTAQTGTEPLARQHHPRDAGQRHAASATSTSCRSPASPRTRRSSTRRSAAAPRTTRASAKGARRSVRGGTVRRAGARGSAPRRRPVPARCSTARDGIDGWVSMEVSPLLADDTARPPSRRRSAIHALGEPSESLRQDSRHARRRPRDRGGDIRRGAGQRDAAVLARTIPRGRRGLSARHRAAHRGRARSAGRFGRLAVRQPLGPGGGDQGARGAAQPAGNRDREAHLPGVCELLDSAALARRSRRPARVTQRLLWASTGTKDPKASARPVRRGAGRARHHRHHAREDPARIRRARAQISRDAARRWRRRGGDLRAFRRGRRRHRRAGAQLQVGGRAVLRQVVAGTHAAHRRQEPGAGRT